MRKEPMYWLYSRETKNGKTRYFNRERDHLFGRKAGRIPKLLSRQLQPEDCEPFPWWVSLRQALKETVGPDHSFVIDIKPKNTQRPVLSFFELLDVWGYSQHGWSPGLLRLQEILRKEHAESIDAKDFYADIYQKPVYSFLYFKGTVSNGKLIDKWIPPRASPTNSVLLWPEALQYFFARIGEATPEILDRSSQSNQP